jgi:hypothetical protein
MVRPLGLLIFFSIFCFGAAPEDAAHQSVTQQAALLTNKDILDLLKAGILPEIVVAKIRTSICRFDTSPAELRALKAAGISDDVILAMVKAPSSEDVKTVASGNKESRGHESQLSPEILAERAMRDSTCPRCKFVLISNVNSQTGVVTDAWVSKEQMNLIKSRGEEINKGKRQATIKYTKYRENADYIVFWASAQGFRPYVIYVPHTETSTANIYGNYSTYGTNGSNFGNFNGIVTVNRTYYQAQNGQWPFIDVNLTIYDRAGRKVYEIWHQGNWRWSKPDKDCLEDALNYLASLNK